MSMHQVVGRVEHDGAVAGAAQADGDGAVEGVEEDGPEALPVQLRPLP
jgi:hypothetical protein